MSRILFVSIFIALYFTCHGQEAEIPAEHTILAVSEGDLDKDKIAEKVIVLDTNDTTVLGTIREIRIYKQSGNKWVLWKSSRNAIRKSQEGGMMGDPFREIAITNGILLISHSGGSSWKWAYTDKYRFENGNFKLIGYSSLYGKPCEYWTEFDFNISTGKIIYKKEYEECENDEPNVTKTETETFYKKGVILTLDNRHTEETKIISPKYKYEFYL